MVFFLENIYVSTKEPKVVSQYEYHTTLVYQYHTTLVSGTQAKKMTSKRTSRHTKVCINVFTPQGEIGTHLVCLDALTLRLNATTLKHEPGCIEIGLKASTRGQKSEKHATSMGQRRLSSH